LVTEEAVRNGWKHIFPVCPMCKLNTDVQVSGFNHNYVQCVACGAKWLLLGKNAELVECARDGRGESYYRKTAPWAFWQNLRTVDVAGTQTILLAKGESQVNYFDDFQEVAGEDSSLLRLQLVNSKGAFTVTNQRVLFICKSGRVHTIQYVVNLEDIMSVSPACNGYCILFLSKDGSRKEFIGKQEQVLLLISAINAATTERRNQLQAQRERERVQVVLDFSSLKDVLVKGGIVMSTYNCPKCNGMLDIPEAGKIMLCKYCGTPVKPVDIFERIKSFL
jgi:hypothetical protein